MIESKFESFRRRLRQESAEIEKERGAGAVLETEGVWRAALTSV